jgi:hypothetical protein
LAALGKLQSSSRIHPSLSGRAEVVVGPPARMTKAPPPLSSPAIQI